MRMTSGHRVLSGKNYRVDGILVTFPSPGHSIASCRSIAASSGSTNCYRTANVCSRSCSATCASVSGHLRSYSPRLFVDATFPLADRPVSGCIPNRGSRRPKKLWHEEGVWDHDMYREEEQGPKSSEELVSIYGYDIRSELMPPGAQRRQHYGSRPNKYEHSWEGEEAYTPQSGSGRGEGACGGRSTRAGSHLGNPGFYDEDFADLHSKPSENAATMQQNRGEVKSSDRPAGFEGSDWTGSNSSQQEKWDHTVKGSGMTHWGWGKRPSLPSRAVPDAPPKQQDCDVKEDVPLGHRVSSPAPQLPVMAVEVPQVSRTAGRSRAIQHLLSKDDQSKREHEALKELAAKGELQGDASVVFKCEIDVAKLLGVVPFVGGCDLIKVV
ncbi:hypothetical protein HPB51_017385 [Rhipicephalus microplus]|uniref:Uncharacterized protein n=1 Tax=Rhipicephalus microplus TaxID=6941 RepID=A0A9J6DBF4_RHIMP|nr:hypothetical protein HPB51_017385 [Rhipicephalus microplus]